MLASAGAGWYGETKDLAPFMLKKIRKTTRAEVMAGYPGVGRTAILAAIKRLAEAYLQGKAVK